MGSEAHLALAALWAQESGWAQGWGFNTFPIPLVRAVLPVLRVTVKIGYRACDIHGVRMQVLVTAVTS